MSKELNIDKLKNAGLIPRVHPNGFIQIDSDETKSKRVHIWPRSAEFILGQKSSSPIHDHIFGMTSRVVKGSLTQLLYNFDLTHAGYPTHEIYMAKYSKPGESTLQPTGIQGVLYSNIHRSEAVVAGEFYTQPAFTFHATVPGIRPLITFMTKNKVYKDFEPRVIVPVDEPPDNDFKRSSASEELLWEIIEDAFN